MEKHQNDLCLYNYEENFETQQCVLFPSYALVQKKQDFEKALGMDNSKKKQ